MDLLKKLLKKNPRERLSASQSLKHPAFTYIQDQILKSEREVDARVSLKAPNLKDFHEKYKFDIKQFPNNSKANIPDSINDLNTPMNAPDDNRVIHQMNIQTGLTPQLQGRPLGPNTRPVEINKSGGTLSEIKEESNTKNTATKKNLQGWL